MKAVRYVINIISTLMIIALLILTVLLVGVRVVGLTPYAVLSGSMEPTYHVGSLIYVKKTDPAQITVGTPITFVVNEDLLVATHRVIEVEAHTTKFEQMKDAEGNLLYEEDGDPMLEEVPLEEPAYYFTTKGDANDVVDGSPVYYKNVIGTPVFSVPYLGYFSNWLQTRKGMIVAISTVLILMILTFLPDLLRWVDDEPAKKQPPKKNKKKQKKRRGAAQEAQEQPARKKKPLTPQEREMIIAGRRERGEPVNGPLTPQERALITSGRRERAMAARRALEAEEKRVAADSGLANAAATQRPEAQTDKPAAAASVSMEEAENVRRRRRRQYDAEN